MAHWAAFLLLSVLFFAPALQASEKAAPGSCAAESLGTFEIAAWLDGRSLRLRDGREVLLAGIEIPSSPATRASLEKLVAGSKVVLKQAETTTDRYGRLLAHVFVVGDGAERWIQEDLLATGQAQVSARPGSSACAKALLAAEAPARQSKRGLWGNSSYGIKASDDLAGLLARSGRFTVSEGKVLSVRESGGTIYINFGRMWSRNLTVTILRRNMRSFEAAGMDPKKLEGARVRVRGWVEERSGPRIEAVGPEQIEIAAQK
jgi:endonuclease YncB( thermonuclease family)